MYNKVIKLNLIFTIFYGVLSAIKSMTNISISINLIFLMLFFLMIFFQISLDKKIGITWIDITVIVMFIISLLHAIISIKVNVFKNIHIIFQVLFLPYIFYYIWKISFQELMDVDIFLKKTFIYLIIISMCINLIYYFNGGEERIQNVLLISDIIGFMYFLQIKDDKFLILGVISAISLITIGSFASASTFCIIIAMYCINYYFKIKKTKINLNLIVYLFFIIIIGVFILLTLKKDVFLQIKVNNFIKRLYDFKNGTDLSYIARNNLLHEGIKIIKRNFIFGEFLYEIRIFGITGGYIHNILSVLAEYGSMVFLIYTFIIIKMVLFMYKHRYKYSEHFLATIFTVVLILFARAYVFNLIWYIFGIFSSLYYREKYQIKVNK